MITVYPYEELGHADHGWLNARHHFSFARYWNPARENFGVLRIINDDIVAGGHGFGAHPHDNMEIITYVRDGAITHGDNMGNEGRTEAGDVQVMSAGSGVFHSERNRDDKETRLYQIWIEPNARNVTPRWEQRAFPKNFADGTLPLLVSGRDEDKEKGAIFIHQDAAISAGRVKAGASVTQNVKHQAYILASEGRFTVNGIEMKKGDGAEVTGDKKLEIKALDDAEILVIDVPALN
ncbi:MAG: pirin family protein [Pseudomonadota bacterium]